jgi:hypothetical protein
VQIQTWSQFLPDLLCCGLLNYDAEAAIFKHSLSSLQHFIERRHDCGIGWRHGGIHQLAISATLGIGGIGEASLRGSFDRQALSFFHFTSIIFCIEQVFPGFKIFQ